MDGNNVPETTRTPAPAAGEPPDAGRPGSMISRRGFLTGSVAGAVSGSLLGGCEALGLRREGIREEDLFTPPPTVEERDGMPYRVFGRTGERVSILGVGGYHIGVQATPEESTAIIRKAIDHGVNFMDNAWEYNQGMSEVRMGLALQDGYREKTFLMTKVCGRDQKTAMENLEESLRRLKTDVIDLWQFHECNYDNDPEWIFSEDGAIHAAIRARQQGKIRFIGFTGHKSPHIHLRMLAQDFDWNALQCPLNVMDAHYRSFIRQVLPVAMERGLGVVGMKSLGGDGSIPRNAGVSAEECLRYSLSLHIPVCLSGMKTLAEVDEKLKIARNFTPLTTAERTELLRRVHRVAGDGQFERFKSTQAFDSTVHRRQHGLG